MKEPLTIMVEGKPVPLDTPRGALALMHSCVQSGIGDPVSARKAQEAYEDALEEIKEQERLAAIPSCDTCGSPSHGRVFCPKG